MDRETGPLRLLKQLDHVLNVVDDSSRDNVRLEEHLWELYRRFTSLKSLLLFLACRQCETLKELNDRRQLDWTVHLDALQAVVVHLVDDIALVWYEWVRQVEA